jgi:hypothetical protein
MQMVLWWDNSMTRCLFSQTTTSSQRIMKLLMYSLLIRKMTSIRATWMLMKLEARLIIRSHQAQSNRSMSRMHSTTLKKQQAVSHLLREARQLWRSRAMDRIYLLQRISQLHSKLIASKDLRHPCKFIVRIKDLRAKINKLTRQTTSNRLTRKT